MDTAGLKRALAQRVAKYKRQSTSSRSVPRMPVGLRRYIDTRGTPRGTYEVVRTVTGFIDISSTGMNIGAASYVGGTFVWTPTNVTLYSGIVGNVTAWNIPNAAEMAALWDKVKLDKVECLFTSSGIGASNSTVQQPLVLLVEDDNDTPTSPDQIKQMDCKVWQLGDQNNPIKMTCRPKYQRIVYYTAATSSYEPTRGYVVSGTDIPHFGLKIGLDPTGGIGRISFSFKIFFKFKELK